MVYLYTFIDNDNTDTYHIITNKNCDYLLEDIEKFYYDFEDFDTKEELIEYLTQHKADKRLIEYITKIDTIDTNAGIVTFTYDILADLDALVSFEEKNFYY